MHGRVSLISQNWIDERVDAILNGYTVHITTSKLFNSPKTDNHRASYTKTLCDVNAFEAGGEGTIPYKVPLKYYLLDPGDVKLCYKCRHQLDKLDGVKATKAIKLWLSMHRLGVTPTVGPRIKVYT